MKKKIETIGKWLLDNSLWLAGLGLFIASSGIDGAYLVKLNEWGKVGGYALNTTSDIVGMLLMFWFGVFRQNEKKKNFAWGLIASEVVTVAYSWLFSWRQYRMMIFDVEKTPVLAFAGENFALFEVELLAFAFAGFIPLLLAFVGYAQGLQVTDNQTASDSMSTSLPVDIKETITDLQSKLAQLQYPPAELQWFKTRIAGLNGSLSKYQKMTAYQAVQAICLDGGKRFDKTERTAATWFEFVKGK